MTERILHHLRVHGPATAVVLAHHLDATPASLDPTLRALERAGRVMRVPGDQQRRGGPRWMVVA